MTIKFTLRKAYNLRIHHIKCLGITKEKLVNELSKTYPGMIVSIEKNKEPRDDGCDSHLHAILQGENINPKTVIQKVWPTCRGNAFIAAKLMEKGILPYMAYLLKEDLHPIILNVSKVQLNKAKKISYLENKNGEMKASIKKVKEEWLCTEPRGPCKDTTCSTWGNHKGCAVSHTLELYHAIGDIYNKYGKDLRISTQQMICIPACKRLYPGLIRTQALRANQSMWGEFE